MNEPRKAGRPRKHLHDDHHFKPAQHVETEAVVTDAIVEEPVVEEIGKVDDFDSLVEPPLPVAQEAVGEEPVLETIVSSPEPVIESSVEETPRPVVENHREGWHTMDTEIILKQPPRNGMPIYLASSIQGEGVLGFWKRTRAFNGKRYEDTGKWVDFHTGMDIPFKPEYWKERF